MSVTTKQDVQARMEQVLSDSAAALAEVMGQYPSLHIGGLGVTPSFEYGPTDETRNQLAGRLEGFAQAVTWCGQNAIPARHFVRSNRYHPVTSYGQKHVMERDTGVYVENGVYIAAMLALGFRATDEYNPHCNAHLSHGGSVKR